MNYENSKTKAYGKEEKIKEGDDMGKFTKMMMKLSINDDKFKFSNLLGLWPGFVRFYEEKKFIWKKDDPKDSLKKWSKKPMIR